MDTKGNQKFKKIDYVLLSVFIAASVYIYWGFYFPDQYILQMGMFPTILSVLIRIFFPVIIAFIAVLYIKVRLKVLDFRLIILFCFSVSIATIVGYETADFFYQEWHYKNRKKYHPYLQLSPKQYIERKESSKNIKIFCLGGSTTELPDTDGTDWQTHTERILKSNYAIYNVEIHNLGREWYTTLHTLINFQTNLRHHNPDYIIIMQSINDLLHNADFSVFSHDSFREDYGHFYGPVNRIINHGSLGNKIKELMFGLWYCVEQEEVTTNIFPGLVSYKRNINTIIELAQTSGIKVILMSEPSLFKENMTEGEKSLIYMLRVEAIGKGKIWSLETARNGMKIYNEELKNIAQNKKIHFIDLDTMIPKTTKYFRDEVHYTDTTYHVIASSLASELHTIIQESILK